MGTNFYATKPAPPPCECCGRGDPDDELHIGKSSGGWVFALHVIPERGLASLDDWKAYWRQPGVAIRNEYGETLTPDEMEGWIATRMRNARRAESRHSVGREPSCDHIAGDFS